MGCLGGLFAVRSKFFRSAVACLVVALLASIAPMFYDNQLLLFNFIIFLVLAQGVNMAYGFTGYLPFGYVGFFGAGAYGFAIAVMHFHLGPAGAMIVGAVCSVAFGAILIPTLKLSGAYFAIANLAAGLAIEQIVANPAMQSITEGPYGVSLSGIYAPVASYGVAVAVLVFTTACVFYLRYSKFGWTVKAVRDDEIGAAMAGVNITLVRSVIWSLSALVAGLAGAVFAWYISAFYPENVFSTNYSVFAIVFALFGGVGTVVGPIIGVLALYGLYNYIGVTQPEYFQLVYGTLIVVLMLFLPNGIVSILGRRGVKIV